MLLRRLATAIRRQDWFTIIIEFVIVVAGIFVGLQVTEWNEQRQLRERELNYLVRLAEDVDAMRTEIAEIQARAEGLPDSALRAFRALEACDAALAEPNDFQLTFAFYQNQRTVVLVERTYEEMLASGALAAMADRQLSSAIAGMFSGLRNYKGFVTEVRISLPVIDQVLWRHLDLSYDEEGVPTLRNFDFDAACANRELRNAAWEIYDLFWDWQRATVHVTDQLDSFSIRLDDHLAARGVAEAP